MTITLPETVTSEPASAAAVDLRRVVRHYPGTTSPAVDNVSLTVHPGEVLALVGPSGCGKSTTLRMIAGLEPLDGGELFLDGIETTHTRPEARRIGWVPQSYGLFPHMTVADNVAYGLKARRVSKVEAVEAVEGALRLTRVWEYADRTPAKLSGGQRQRVALARALATDPRVLLLDEPLAALDPQLRDELRAELATILRTAGRATVLVTHDQHEALALADKIAILNDGRLIQCDTPAELWRHPADAFVAAFLTRGTVLRAERNGDAIIVGNEWALPLSELDAFNLEGATSYEVVIRPRDLEPSTAPNALRLAVKQAEYLGDTVRVHGVLGSDAHPIVLELSAGTPIADVVTVRPRLGAITVRGLQS